MKSLVPEEDRDDMYKMWLEGYEFQAIADKYETYRQKTRAIILALKPNMKDSKTHSINKVKLKFNK